MKKIAGFAAGVGIGSFIAYTLTKYFEPRREEKTDKFKSYYNMLNMWIELEEKGRTVDVLLREAGYKRIAVYGMGNMGKRLCKVLRGTSVEVLYGIDSYAGGDFMGVEIKSAEDFLPEVDSVVVTIPFAFAEIKNKLEKKTECPVVSLEHILFEV